MKPVVFDGCFGWLHGSIGETGVVLCSPYGHEEAWSHRSRRGLAEHLAKHDFPTLRFDYRGTGDSIEREDDGDRIQAWLDSVCDAVRFMRKTTKITRVVLCGIRLGGLLAAQAAERLHDIDGLILMAPVTSGREYLRELKVIQRRWRNTSAPHILMEDSAGDYVETLGFRLNSETVTRLSGLSLIRERAVTVSRVLILDPVKVEAAVKLRDFYASAGAEVEVLNFPDYAHLLSESISTPAPVESYARVLAWMKGFSKTHADNQVSDEEGIRTSSTFSAVAAFGVQRIAGDGFTETPVIFGHGRLFGIYCSPTPTKLYDASNTYDVQQAVLFSNTARSHHIGEARMWVNHARRLARQGVASLRMDVGLLGDSLNAAVSVSVADLHTPQSVMDVSAGIDWLVAAGHARPTAVGICSGAYLTFHAAASHPAIAGVTLINQREYFWAEGREHTIGAVVASTAVYMQSIRSAEKWKRLLSGEMPIGAIVGTLLKRRSKQWAAEVTYLVGKVVGVENATANVRKKFEALSRRGVNVQIIYGSFDEGLELNAGFVGKDFRWINRLPNFAATTVEAMDHALFLYPARESMIHTLERQLLNQKTVPADIGCISNIRVLSRAPQSQLGDAVCVDW